MNEGASGYGQYQYPSPPPPRKTHRFRNWVVIPVAALTGSIVLIAVIAGITDSGAGHPAAVSTVRSPSAPPAPAATVPAAVTPSPDGTFTGSCNYDLGSDPAGGTAVATGDIDAVNTGNIGIVIRLTLTWPQEGFSPLSESKTVRLARGGEKDVQFNKPLSFDQLDRLQNWQTGHGYKDGCTYNGSMTSTFGSAS